MTTTKITCSVCTESSTITSSERDRETFIYAHRVCAWEQNRRKYLKSYDTPTLWDKQPAWAVFKPDRDSAINAIIEEERWRPDWREIPADTPVRRHLENLRDRLIETAPIVKGITCTDITGIATEGLENLNETLDIIENILVATIESDYCEEELPNKGLTTDEYWDCNCMDYYIQPASVSICPVCGAHKNEQPSARVIEVEAGTELAENRITATEPKVSNGVCSECGSADLQVLPHGSEDEVYCPHCDTSNIQAVKED